MMTTQIALEETKSQVHTELREAEIRGKSEFRWTSLLVQKQWKLYGTGMNPTHKL